MMTLRVIGTGSSGNAYLLTDANDNTLILDAGMKAQKIFASIQLSQTVCGCLVTHEHGDHSRAVFDLALRGVRVGMSEGTRKSINAENALNVEVLKEKQTYAYGVYRIMPFVTQHDAAEPFGFLIEHMGTHEKVLYATDTYYLHYRFPNVTYWIIECNYLDDCIHEANHVLRNRLMTSHMSLRRLKQALDANDLSSTITIVLVHLSDSRSDEVRMIDEIQKQTGIETIAAHADQSILLDTIPF